MADRIRVWFVLTSLGNIGGAERVIYQTIAGLAPQRFEPVQVLFYQIGDLGTQLAEKGIPTFTSLASSRKDLRLPFRLRRLAKQMRPDVVFTTESTLPLFWCGLLRRLGSLPAYVVAIHTTRRPDPKARLAFRMGMPVAARIVALSPTHRELWQQRTHLPAEKFAVIPNGTDVHRFREPEDKRAVRRELGLPEDRLLVGVITFFKAFKNLPLFVEVAHRVLSKGVPAHFVMVGDGPEKEALVQNIQQRAIQAHFSLPGLFLDPVKWHQALDVELLTSSSDEAFPVTLVEAHACGVPVVATDIGGIRDIVVQDETGFILPPGDAEGLTARVIELLQNPDLRVRLGRQARARAVQEFSLEMMVQRYATLFEEVAIHSTRH
ncbi:MAG: glycosyltransferase [candidate division WOR-3 bacterium]